MEGTFLVDNFPSPLLPALGKGSAVSQTFPSSVSASPAPLAGGVQMLSRA